MTAIVCAAVTLIVGVMFADPTAQIVFNGRPVLLLARWVIAAVLILCAADVASRITP